MPDVSQLFGAEPGAAPTSGHVDELFGGPSAKEPETSPLARSRAALPKAAEKTAPVGSAPQAVGAPSPADIQRNAEDFGSGLERQIGLFGRAVGKAAAGAVGGMEALLPSTGDPASILSRGLEKRRTLSGQITGVQEEDVIGPSASRTIEREVEKRTPKPATGLERGVEAVTEFAAGAIMPGLPGAKVPGVTPMSNNAAGVSLLSAGTSKAGDALGTVADDFYKTSRMVYQKRAEWITDVTNYVPKNWSSMAAKVDDFLEGTAAGPLNAEEKKMATNIQLMNAKTAKMREQVKAFGYDVGPDEPGYIGSRLAVGKPSLISTVASSAPTGKARGLFTGAQEFKPRIVHGLEGQGEKNLHLVDNSNGTFTVWRNKEKIAGGKFQQEELEQGKVSFTDTKTGTKQQFSIVPSTKRAIEEHTNIQYYHDPLLSAITANMHVSEALNAAQFLEKMKFSPELANFRAAPNKVFPEGWRGVDVPQLRGYKFDPHLANVIDDFALPAKTGGFKVLNDLSRMTVGSMFWNPLPHAFNVNAFGLVEQGLMGTAAKLGHPIDEMKLMMKAHREVLNIGPDFRAAVREGAGLQYNAVVAQNFTQKLAAQLGASPEMGAAAKAWGYANPIEMWKRVMDFSKQHLWSWNDTIMMHAYYARQAKGADLPSAIKDVEHVIPNYRMPAEAWKGPGGRTAAQLWQVLPTFARYHWGVLSAYGNMAKGLVAGNAQEKAKSLDRLAMLALGSAVVYPALDQAIRMATGNDEARLRRFGPFSIPDAIYRFSVGDARYATLSSAVLGISPMFSVPVALAEGEDPFTGKKFENFGDVVKFAMEQFNPIQTITSYEGAGGRKTGGEILMEQLGIQLPSEAETSAREKAKAREERKREREEE